MSADFSSYCVGKDHQTLSTAVCLGTIADMVRDAWLSNRRSNLGSASREEVLERGAASFPLQRVGTVADIVDSVMFPISEGSSYITGESINVDGGSLAG